MLISDYVTNEYLKKLEAIQFNINFRLKTGFFGARKAVGKGNSIEFADFRQYSFGDDARRIDWKGYARSNKLFIKQFAEEKQATVNIFIDVSGSMGFGENAQNKLFYSKLLAASISYICLKTGERVNIFPYAGTALNSGLNFSTKPSFAKLISFLDGLKPGGKTLNSSISAIANQTIGGGISIVLSDFLSQDSFEDTGKILSNKNQVVIFTHIMSKEEISPANNGKIRMVDSETGEAVDISVDSSALAEYEKALSAYKDKLGKYCLSRGFKYIFTGTNENLFPVLKKIAGF